MTRNLIKVLLLGTSLLGYAGIASAEDVTLTIESWRNDDLSIWKDKIIPAFEAKNPGIKVVFSPSAPTEYNAALNAKLDLRILERGSDPANKMRFFDGRREDVSCFAANSRRIEIDQYFEKTLCRGFTHSDVLACKCELVRIEQRIAICRTEDSDSDENNTRVFGCPARVGLKYLQRQPIACFDDQGRR